MVLSGVHEQGLTFADKYLSRLKAKIRKRKTRQRDYQKQKQHLTIMEGRKQPPRKSRGPMAHPANRPTNLAKQASRAQRDENTRRGAEADDNTPAGPDATVPKSSL
ncbi:ankyrin-2-like [Notolabrus celidotus]|uniref:ankyrin-2-like n=1 Tax=Notolabrus celidotus TaxID=1203425 RepID=UPI0014902A80|nr:ankyrin-2-like [Notolabrus celidotus]